MEGDVQIFDHSSCHGAMVEDSLDVSSSVSCEMVFGIKTQSMSFALEERGVNTHGMSVDEMR